MQYKNPTDIELINAAEAMCVSIENMCIALEVDPVNLGTFMRLRKAMSAARTEMQAQEDLDTSDIVEISPPLSMD